MSEVEFFKCLSDPTRLSIIKLILRNQTICVCELTEALDMSQPKISRHLALLRSHGILHDSRQSQWVYYSLHPQLPHWAVEILKIIASSSENEIPSFTRLSTSQFNTFCE